eukprot:282141-Rhodomonas_salina.1
MVLDSEHQFWIKDPTDLRVAKGLAYMIPCLNTLYDSEHDVARSVVVFPVCVISSGVEEVGSKKDLKEWLLVYPQADMTAPGFQVGIPDHNSSIF